MRRDSLLCVMSPMINESVSKVNMRDLSQSLSEKSNLGVTPR